MDKDTVQEDKIQDLRPCDGSNIHEGDLTVHLIGRINSPGAITICHRCWLTKFPRDQRFKQFRSNFHRISLTRTHFKCDFNQFCDHPELMLGRQFFY